MSTNHLKKRVFLGVVAAHLMLASPLMATVTFTAGGGAIPTVVAPGSSFGIAISFQNFVNVSSFSFSLSWDPAVVQFVSVGSFNSSMSSVGTFTVNEETVWTSQGKFGVIWDAANSQTFSDGTAFTLNLSATGAEGTSSQIQFTATPTPINVVINDVEDPLFFNGQQTTVLVEPVPEPIEWALGVFACVLVGVKASRRFFKRAQA